MALLTVLLIVNTGVVDSAPPPNPPGGCTCEEDWETGGMWPSWDDCGICGYARCIGTAGACECETTSDFSSSACSNPICRHYFNEYGDHAYWVASTSVYNAGDATGTGYCCGNEIGEKYVYSGVQGCCDDLDDCATSTGLCVDTGDLDPSQTRVCRDATGMARDDWHTCSSSSYTNRLYSVVGKVYCCVDSGGWKWVGPFCTCSYSKAVCLGASCGGYWIDALENPIGNYDTCCTGSLFGIQESPGDGWYNPSIPGWDCGTLDSGSTSDCFVDQYIIPR